MNQNFVIFSAVQITIQQALYWGLVLLFVWDVWIACGISLLPLLFQLVYALRKRYL